jgi:hypothetical protein
MSRAAVSLFVFGLYLLVIGTVILVVPNVFLAVFGLPATAEVWIRVMAMLLLFLGCYDVLSARAELKPFFRWSVPLRASVILFFAVFVALQLVQPVLLLFGVIDLAAATWTAVALRADTRAAAG